jgi:hypothetical protein
MVDASFGGMFMLKTEDDMWTLFENLAENSLHHSSSSRRAPISKNQRSETLFEVSHPLDLTAKVDALSRKIDQLMASSLYLRLLLTFQLHMKLVHFALTHRIE